MPLDNLIRNGDKAIFDQAFGPALVIVQPGVIKAKSPRNRISKGEEICVVDDISTVKVENCKYQAGGFLKPGAGTLIIKALAGNQQGAKMTVDGKKVILKGAAFIAEFQVTQPAQMPPPANTPDPMKMYPGTGKFFPANRNHKGS